MLFGRALVPGNLLGQRPFAEMVVAPAGVEPAARGLGNRCSIRLSYGAVAQEDSALGEVTKFLVYNARKRQKGGDRADQYFARTECVAGVQDMRFQELMPDVLHWLGIRKIDAFVSMSNMKSTAVKNAGITIGRQVQIPESLVPPDARVEMDAKIAAGYHFEGQAPDATELQKAKGRQLAE